ncbi:MAG: hypothetical protein KDJ83_11545 [Rhodobacteraceae bacterium]|nr:hypothetical protein [Paracoccaceae bacterium]
MSKVDDRVIEMVDNLERKARWTHAVVRQAREVFENLTASDLFSDAFKGLADIDCLEDLLGMADHISRDARKLADEVRLALD